MRLKLFVVLLLLACVLGVNVGNKENVRNEITLSPPPFIAEAAETGAKAFPEDEAGISAYVKVEQQIDLNKLKDAFTRVEDVGGNYIIGIVNISNFGGDIEVHVYADTNGWIVAYLKNNEPSAKIVQWGTADVDNPIISTITSTTLVDALYKAGEAAGVGIASNKISYYDFEFPNADGMVIFIKTRATDGSNIVQVKIPSTYTLYEASYYHYIYYKVVHWGWSYHSWDSKLKVDGTIVSDAATKYNRGGTYWWRSFGTYGGLITTGKLHTIEISYEKTHEYSEDKGSAGVATVLIYKSK